MTKKELKFYDSGRLIAKSMVGILACIFGAFCFCCGLSRMQYSIGGDDIFLAALGFLTLGFGIFWFRFSLNPRVVLTENEVIVRGFYWVRRWKYDDIESIAANKKTIKPEAMIGTRVVKFAPKVIENISIRSLDGKEHSFVGPNFDTNHELLEALVKRCGRVVETSE